MTLSEKLHHPAVISEIKYWIVFFTIAALITLPAAKFIFDTETALMYGLTLLTGLTAMIISTIQNPDTTTPTDTSP